MKQQYDLLVKLHTLTEQMGKTAQRLDGIFYDYQSRQGSEILEDVAIAIDSAVQATTALHYALGARLSDYRNIRGRK